MGAPSLTNLDSLAGAPAVLSNQAVTGVDPNAPIVSKAPEANQRSSTARAALDALLRANGYNPKTFARQESTVHQVLTRLGFTTAGIGIVPSFQLQYSIDRNDATATGTGIQQRINRALGNVVLGSPVQGKGFRLEIDRFQINARIEYRSPDDYVTSIIRFDGRNKIVQQANFTFRDPNFTPIPFLNDKITFDGFSLLVQADSLPRPRTGGPVPGVGVPGSRGLQFGFASNWSAYGTKIIGETLGILDISTDAKTGRIDPTRFLSIGVNLQWTVPIDLFPSIAAAVPSFGGAWTITFKVFLRIYATAESWVRAAGYVLRTLASEAGIAVAVGEEVAAAGEAVVSTAGEVLTTQTLAVVGIASAMVLGGVAYTTAGLLLIRRALESGRDRAILNNYISGYADELAAIIMDRSGQRFATARREYDGYDLALALEEITAYVHGETPARPYRLQGFSGNSDIARNLNFASALTRGATDLGRATVVKGIAAIVDQNAEEWLTIQRSQLKRIEDRRNRGTFSPKQYYSEALLLRATNTQIGLPLRELDEVLK